MDEANVATKDSAQVKTDSASTGEKATPAPVAKTYTEAELQKYVNDRMSELGRKHKAELEPIIKERDTFKSQAEKVQREARDATEALNETKENISALENDLKELTDSNPDAAEVAKLKKEIRDEKSKLAKEYRDKQDALAELQKIAEKEREQWAGTIAEYQMAQFEVDIVEVAEQYGTDSEKLKALAEKAGKKTREEIEELAGVIWTKKTPETTETEPALLNDSGVNKGGSGRNKYQIMDDFNKGIIKRAEYEKQLAAIGVKPPG